MKDHQRVFFFSFFSAGTVSQPEQGGGGGQTAMPAVRMDRFHVFFPGAPKTQSSPLQGGGRGGRGGDASQTSLRSFWQAITQNPELDGCANTAISSFYTTNLHKSSSARRVVLSARVTSARENTKQRLPRFLLSSSTRSDCCCCCCFSFFSAHVRGPNEQDLMTVNYVVAVL